MIRVTLTGDLDGFTSLGFDDHVKLFFPDGTISDEGAQLRAEIAGSISAVTAPIYESLTSSDVETTVRTLRYLTTRVRALNLAAPTGPATPADPADPADPAEEPGERS